MPSNSESSSTMTEKLTQLTDATEFFTPLVPVRMSQNLERKVLLVIGVTTLAYFIWMDVALYSHLSARQPSGPPKTPQQTESKSFDPFRDLSVKLLMLHPVEHYMLIPTAHAFVDITRIDRTFVTANMVTFLHGVVGILASRLIISDSLLVRRLSAVLMMLRAWLDVSDGIIYRAQHNPSFRNIQMTTTGTYGSLLDMIVDGLCWALYFTGLYVSLARSKPKEYHHLLPLWRSNGVKQSFDTVSKRVIFLRIFWISGLFATSAAFWDRYAYQYHEILENPNASPTEQKLANEILTSTTTWTIFWFWRLVMTTGLLVYLAIAIFIDRTWEFSVIWQYVGTVYFPILIGATELHLSYVRSYVGLPGDVANATEWAFIFAIPAVAIPVCCLLQYVPSRADT